LALQSENFTTTWAQTGLNITSGFTSPSNNNSGTLIEANASTGRLRQTFAAGLTSGVTSTFSLFAKLGTQSSGVTLVFQEGNATSYSSGVCQSFRLDTGAVGTSGTLGAGFTITRSNIENYGNGWYRCSLTVQLSYTPSSANLTIRPTSTVTANLPVTASGDSCYIFGAQLETGSIATSYIPTTTASATRNAEVVTLSGAVSGCIGQTEGTIYAEVDIKQLPALNARTFIDVGSSGNRVFLGFTSLASNTLRLQIDAGVGGSACVDIRTVVANAGIIKVAVAYQSLNCALYVNGVQATNIQSNFAFSFTTALSALFLGSTVSASAFLNDRIRAAALYTSRLTNDQLQALTT
jgi:hypothetical protein